MKEKSRRTERFLLLVVVGLVPLILVLSYLFDWSSRVTVAAAVTGTIICASMGLWIHANRRANGDEWWQDDDASGWRGY